MENILNISWQSVDIIYFLSKRFTSFKMAYKKISSMYDLRPYKSSPYLFYYDKSFDNKNLLYFNTKTTENLKTELINKNLGVLKDPVLVIYPRNNGILKSLLKKFKSVDILEVNPGIRSKLLSTFGDKINFIDGLPEYYRTTKKYNTVIALNNIASMGIYLGFGYSLNESINTSTNVISFIDIATKKNNKNLIKAYFNITRGKSNIINPKNYIALLNDYDIRVKNIFPVYKDGIFIHAVKSYSERPKF